MCKRTIDLLYLNIEIKSPKRIRGCRRFLNIQVNALTVHLGLFALINGIHVIYGHDILGNSVYFP